MRNRQAGLTLIETILVLLVAAVIIGGIWVAYSQLNLNSQVERTVKVLDETLAVTRDYLSSQSSVPPDLSQRLYNPAAGVNLMPPELTYAYQANSSPWSNDVYGTTQIFMSPLGGEFFVQFPGNMAPPTKVFEVRIRFTNSAGTINVGQCLALVPKLIGTPDVMADRGMVGYWYGSTPIEASWLSAFPGNNPSGVAPTPTLAPLDSTTANQLAACQTAIDIRLYFAMRQ